MTRKELLSMPFVLGVGVMVFAVVVAAAFEEIEFPPCNKHVASTYMASYAICSAVMTNCYDFNSQDCHNHRGYGANFGSYSPGSFRYFDSMLTNNSLNHAIVAGTIVCSYEYYCALGLTTPICYEGARVIDPTTGKQKELRLAYFENDGYCAPVD